MIRSIFLFVHVAGVLGLFASLALEAFGAEAGRRAAPRIGGISVALTIVSGFYLGARIGVLHDTWIRASYLAIVVMAAAGALARRSEKLLRISLYVRTAFGLAVVFLMIAKPEPVVSLEVLGVALVGSALAGLPNGQTQRLRLSRRAS